MTDFVKEGRVGDKVVSLRHGEGEIIVIDTSIINCPIAVKFQVRDIVYTANGKLFGDESRIDLYWPGVQVIDGPAPKRKVKKEFKFWVNFYPSNEPIFHRSLESANIGKSPAHCILTKEYTEIIEVDE